MLLTHVSRPQVISCYRHRGTLTPSRIHCCLSLILIQREAWQNIKAIGESKAEVSSFCLELSKKLEMRYISPPLPVDLAFVNRGGTEGDNASVAAKMAGFAIDDPSGMEELVALYDKKK